MKLNGPWKIKAQPVPQNMCYMYTSHRKHDASFIWINSNEAWRLKVKG